jgi:hypothetical protein
MNPLRNDSEFQVVERIGRTAHHIDSVPFDDIAALAQVFHFSKTGSEAYYLDKLKTILLEMLLT